MRIVTVFRSRLRPGAEEAYAVVAEEMRQLVATMDGFVDQSFYTSADGERVTVVRFRDVESHRAWANHPDHVKAQVRGRRDFYAWYELCVAEELYEREYEEPRS